PRLLEDQGIDGFSSSISDNLECTGCGNFSPRRTARTGRFRSLAPERRLRDIAADVECGPWLDGARQAARAKCVSTPVAAADPRDFAQAEETPKGRRIHAPRSAAGTQLWGGRAPPANMAFT